MFLNKEHLLAARKEKLEQQAQEEALVALRIKAVAVVTHLESSGKHWTFTAKPKHK
jgi:hypothetical protein